MGSQLKKAFQVREYATNNCLRLKNEQSNYQTFGKLLQENMALTAEVPHPPSLLPFLPFFSSSQLVDNQTGYGGRRSFPVTWPDPSHPIVGHLSQSHITSHTVHEFWPYILVYFTYKLKKRTAWSHKSVLFILQVIYHVQYKKRIWSQHDRHR